MLNKTNIRKKFLNFKQGFRLYPSSIIFSILLGLLLIYASTISSTEENKILLENLKKLQMLLGILIFIFLTISNINLISNNKYKPITNILGVLSGALIYFFLINKKGIRYDVSFIGLFIAFFISSISIVKDKNNFSFYIIKVIEDIVITFTYILVILIGSFIIIFTTEFLFEFTLKSYVKEWVLIVSVFILGNLFFISNLPNNLKEYKDYQINKPIKILVEYVILSLIIIYTLVLYIYLAKVAITHIWPKGLVSHLVLWYLCFSLVILVLINDSKEKISLKFKKYFPKLSIPLIIMSFIAVGIRIDQYGFTENRYFIIALGVFTLFSMLIYIFQKEKDLRVFSVLLILTILISLFSPINAFKISKSSQNNRLKKILIRNNMLINDKVIENKNLPQEDIFEISNIIYYFKNKHTLSDLKYFNNIDFNNFKKDYGFEYTPDIWYKEDFNYNEYFNLNGLKTNNILNISRYDNLFKINSIKAENISNNGVNILLDSNNNLLIYNKNKLVFDRSIEDIIFNILKDNINTNLNNVDLNKLIYKFEDEKIKIILIPNEISGEKIKEDGNFIGIKISYLDFYTLFTFK